MIQPPVSCGLFDGTHITIKGTPKTQNELFSFGDLQASATLNSKGQLDWHWETEVGAAGTFVLFSHDRAQDTDHNGQGPDQIHTARHEFGAREIDRTQIIAVADEIQREFTNGKVIVTVDAGSEQARFLEDFRDLKFNSDRARFIKIYVQEPDIGDQKGCINRIRP